jgi:hypothetical protein
LAFGEMVIAHEDVPLLQTEFGALRVVTPTHSVMDRMAAYVHWNDNQAMDQAVMIARRQPIDWSALQDWARQEGMDDKVLEKLRRRAEKS